MRLFDPVIGPRRSRPLRAALVLSLAFLILFVFACAVDWRVQGAWGQTTLVRGRLNLEVGRPIPLPQYSSHFRFVHAQIDPAVDFHFYPAQPAAGRSQWWFIRLPLWIPVVVFAAPTLVYWLMLIRSRPAWQCRACGYDLRGVKGEACPECGRGAPG